jgi:hypothetical protein
MDLQYGMQQEHAALTCIDKQLVCAWTDSFVSFSFRI